MQKEVMQAAAPTGASPKRSGLLTVVAQLLYVGLAGTICTQPHACPLADSLSVAGLATVDRDEPVGNLAQVVFLNLSFPGS